MTVPMDIQRLTGDCLDVRLLHEILALRSEVFVVEQSCHYQDLDGRDLDPSTVHLWARGPDDRIESYLRILDDGDVHRIGRVVTAPAARGAGLASALVRVAIDETGRPVVLSAQAHLTGWYERFGFVVDGPEYLDAGLPHRPMRLT
jgi:ElaA protein